MLLAKVEFEKVSVEKIVEHLADKTEAGLRVWLYDKKVYAMFKTSSLAMLKRIIESFKANNIKHRFFRIEEV